MSRKSDRVQMKYREGNTRTIFAIDAAKRGVIKGLYTEVRDYKNKKLAKTLDSNWLDSSWIKMADA